MALVQVSCSFVYEQDFHHKQAGYTFFMLCNFRDTHGAYDGDIVAARLLHFHT